MFYLYPVLIAKGNYWKEFLENNNNKLIADIGAKRSGVDIKRPSFIEVYDFKGDLYVVVEESKLEETLELFNDHGIELSKDPDRILTSPLQLFHFLGYEA